MSRGSWPTQNRQHVLFFVCFLFYFALFIVFFLIPFLLVLIFILCFACVLDRKNMKIGGRGGEEDLRRAGEGEKHD